MSPTDQDPTGAQQLAVLEAIDATLAGEPVDPRHAEMAELALLLADERPGVDAGFAAGLDRAVERRFAPPPGEHPARQPRVRRAIHGRWLLWAPALGIAAALIAAIVVVASQGPGRRVMNFAAASGPPQHSSSAASSTPSASGGTLGLSQGAGSPAPAPSSSAGGRSSSGGLQSSSSRSPQSSASGALQPPSPGALQPPANGRKIIQAAQLSLSTAPARLETVAQEIFDVVGQFQGIVNSSNVTATSGPGGSAAFQLSIPSSSLPRAMAALSTLRYARVAARTDTTQDVNGQYQSDVRALADARALRTSLLKQLAGATTQAQINSLTARIHDAEASISSDEATLRSLNHQIDYSEVSVTVDGGIVGPVPVQHGGFGLGKAAHDAGRVLTVAAGIMLIGLAALVPLGLLAALAWWIHSMSRRRRREHALDLV